MSNILDLGDPATVRTFARRILEVTDPALFESARYMPVTRDLSRGKRELLQRFCQRLLDGDAPPQAAAPTDPDTRTAVAMAVTEQSEPAAPPHSLLPGVPAGAAFDKRAQRST
jgi:hypothetical protein